MGEKGVGFTPDNYQTSGHWPKVNHRVVVTLTLLEKTESVKGWKKPSLRIRSLSLKKQNAISVTNWCLPAKKSRTPSNQE